MKRISALTIIAFTFLSSVANAYYSNRIPLRYRTGYSPYAFSYKYPSGLISGELRYSPYAFSYHHSGLVPYWVEYSPYAFSYKHPSGLVSDFWSGPYYFGYGLSYGQFGASDCDSSRSGCVSGDNSADLLYYQMRQKYEENLKARDERVKTLRKNQQETTAAIEIDGGEIIRQYLASKNVDFQMNRILRIGDRMLSADFLLRNKNLLIKYWNPAEVELAAQDSGHKKNIYEKYRQTCIDFGEQFRQQGGKIYQIKSADTQEILEKLRLIVSS